MKLYRAGDPVSGPCFWSASQEEAKAQAPELALHEAEVLPGARIKKFEGVPRTKLIVETCGGEWDMLVFCAADGTYEYVVLNPHVLRILK